MKFMLKLKKKKIIFFHSEKCKNLSFVCYAKKKAKPIGHDLPKALFRSVLLRELTEVEDLTSLQQERREKNVTGVARPGNVQRDSTDLRTSDGSVESALN